MQSAAGPEERAGLFGIGHDAFVTRLQLTAFLPRPVRDEVDAVRREWDPVMARRIDAHVTAVYDLPEGRLSNQADLIAVGPFDVLLGGAMCWGEPCDGIYLQVDDIAGGIRQVRQALAVANSDGLGYKPHVTLTHPRTTPTDRADEAWSYLESWHLDVRAVVDSLAVIARADAAWQTIETVHLRGEA